MTPKHGKTPESEGMESLMEESEGSLAANPDLEAALREAAEALDETGRVREEGHELAAGESPEVSVAFADPGPASDEVEKLRGEAQLAHERLMRMQADFENFRRRALKERTEDRQYGHQNLVKDLLSTVDNLDRAIDHARGAGGNGEAALRSLLEGVELVRRELLGALAKHGVSEIEAAGQPFDPALHEAMAQREDPSVAANTVVEVLEKGYQLRSRLVRPSRVIVAQGGPDAVLPAAAEGAAEAEAAGPEGLDLQDAQDVQAEEGAED